MRHPHVVASFHICLGQYENIDLRSGRAADTTSGPNTESSESAAIPESFTASTTSTPTTQPTVSSDDALVQPSIIVLHQSPFIAHATTTTLCPWIQGNQSAFSPEMTSSSWTRRRRSGWGVYPEMLLAPGALETIVVRNGTFFVRESATVMGNRTGHQQAPELTADHFAPKVSITRTTSHQ